MSAPKVFSLDEVKKHTAVDDLWIALHGKVYNVTQFLEEHPGGDGVLMDNAGTDATSEFDAVGHSTEAMQMLEQYYIGDLEGYKGAQNEPKKAEAPKIKLSDINPKTPPPTASPAVWKQIAIPLLIVAIGFAARFYFSS